MSTLPELRDIEATITKLRAERDQLGGSLVLLLEAVMAMPPASNAPSELEALAEFYAVRITESIRSAGHEPDEVSAANCIDTLAESVRHLAGDPTPPAPEDAPALGPSAYDFVMACPHGEARSATDEDGWSWTWDRSGS